MKPTNTVAEDLRDLADRLDRGELAAGPFAVLLAPETEDGDLIITLGADPAIGDVIGLLRRGRSSVEQKCTSRPFSVFATPLGQEKGE